MEAHRPARPNQFWFAGGAALYLALTFLIGGGVLWITLWAYGAAEEELSDTISAAVLNTTAATLLWLAFFGGFDMFLTLWTIMQNRQMEAERQHREAADREAERISRAQEVADQRAFQQGIIEMLTAERERNRQEREQFLATLQEERERSNLMMTRFMDLAERLGNRNGNGASDKG